VHFARLSRGREVNRLRAANNEQRRALELGLGKRWEEKLDKRQ